MIPRPLALAIVCVVSLVWVGNWALVGASALHLIGEYQSDVSINGIFMVLVGGALIVTRRRENPAASDEDDELPDGVPAPPGFAQARRFAAEVLDPQIRAREQQEPPPPRPRHRRPDDGRQP